MRGLITWVGLTGIRGGPEGVMRFAVDAIGAGRVSEGRRGGPASTMGLRGGSGGSLPWLDTFRDGTTLSAPWSRARNGF